MDTCKQVLQALTEYLEGDLAPEEKERFERHMRDCPPCRAFLRTYQKAGELARRTLREGDVPEEVRQRVRDFLRARLGLEK
jgi:anti-sigma factor (TIGR02949 family)